MKNTIICVDHGMDNYKEYIDLDEVVFVQIYSRILDVKTDDWEHRARIVFRNGITETVVLSGYGDKKLHEHLMGIKTKKKNVKKKNIECCPVCGNRETLVHEDNKENETNTLCTSCGLRFFR